MNIRAKIKIFISASLLTAFSTNLAASEVELARGKEVFKTTCVTCHGEKFDGMGPAGQYMNPHPRNLATDKFKQGETAAQIFKTLSDGIPGTGMASFATLPEGDRKALAAYIVSIRKGK